jgi:predicted nucleic acid-binding protein
VRRSHLPDFFLAAHAAIARYSLLTRDADRYCTDSPRQNQDRRTGAREKA